MIFGHICGKNVNIGLRLKCIVIVKAQHSQSVKYEVFPDRIHLDLRLESHFIGLKAYGVRK